MKPKNRIILLSCLLLIGCTQTSVVLLDDSLRLAPSDNVRIIEQPPEESFQIIARLETRGAANQSIPPLLNQMREEAKKIGADAIIPVEERQEWQQQGLLYNPWLGGYQTIGGGNVPIVTSYAIILERSIPQRMTAYRPDPIINGGVSFNVLAPVLNGYGFSGWVGKNRFRGAIDYYSVEIPSAMSRDGFNDGKVENAARLSFDYFFLGDLKGPYFGGGFQYARYSSGHENTTERGEWESLDFNASFGFKLNLLPNIHFDVRVALDAVIYGEEEIMIGFYRMVPDDAKIYGLVGFGIHF